MSRAHQITFSTILLAGLMLVPQWVGGDVVMVGNVGGANANNISRRHNDRIIIRLPAMTVTGSTPKRQPNEFIAQFEDAHPDMRLTVLDAIPDRGLFLLHLQAPRTTNFDALELELETAYLTHLRWVEMMYNLEAPEGGTGSVHVDDLVGLTDYHNQFVVNSLGIAQANTLSDGQYTTVAILDTGVDATHPAFGGHVLPIGIDFVDNDANPNDVGDGLDTDGDGAIDEMTGHGTFVAGLVSLIASEARIMPVRVLNGDGVGDNWILAKGLFYAIDNGADIINLSLRSTYNSQAVEDALREANQQGIFVAAAAGNENRDLPREFPAMGKAHGVAALDNLNIKAGFSNFSNRLFISAPGGNQVNPDGTPIPSQSIISAFPGGGYSVWEGTSMATPLVSATAVLIKAQHPHNLNWPIPVLRPEKIVDNILQILTTSATNIDSLNPDFVGMLGVGSLNIGAAVALGPPAPQICAGGDVNYDGIVDATDLVAVINSIGPCPAPCPTDFTGDGIVNADDIVVVINNIGPCF